MLPLDPRRRRRSSSGRLGRLISRLPAAAWPAPWALAVLVAAMEGGRQPSIAEPWQADLVLRLTALAPLGLTVRTTGSRALVWGAVVLGAWWGGALTAGSPPPRPPAVAETAWAPSRRAGTTGLLAGRVLADPRRHGADRWSAAVQAVAWHADGAGAPLPGDGVLLRGRGEAPPRGARIAARATVRPPRTAGIPGGFDERTWLRGRGLLRVAYADSVRTIPPPDPVARAGAAFGVARSRLAGRLGRMLPPREASVAAAVLLGRGPPDHLRDPFVGLGLAHLFALSGLHVGIVAGLGLLVLRPLPLPAPTRDLLLIPALLAYAVLVDLPGSVVRAVGLVSLALLGRACGRAGDSLRAIGLVFWGNVLWRPAAVLDVGVQLSYLAAGGILAGQRLLAPWRAAMGRIWRMPAAALGVTVSAQVATLPVVARAFGVLPLLGPLVNLAAVPLFSLVVSALAGGLALGCACPWAGEGLLAVGAVALRAILAGTHRLAGTVAAAWAGLPDWSTGRMLLYLALVALLAAVLRHRGRRPWLAAPAAYGAIVAVASVSLPTAAPVTVWQLDVGQGDCALIEFRDGWRALIDTGERWRGGGGPLARDVWPWLRRRGVRRLDAVVLTHGHADHTGGAADLADRLAIDRWLVSGKAAAPAGAAALRPAVGDTLHACGAWALVCLHPGPGDRDLTAENDQSLALGLVAAGRLRGLWSGDLEQAGERRLLPRCPPPPPAGLDVWKAGHHGSATSGSDALLRKLRPRLVVISAGVANRHHHPSHGPYVSRGDTLPVLRTDLHGTVRLRWRSAGLAARCARSP